MSEVPLWLDEPYEPRAALDGALRCEVCVVGAGAGGLATAWHLAERGVRDVVVLDRGVVAGGASGRNGGFFIAGAAPLYDRARSLFGHERARAIYAATLATQREMLAVAEAVGARDAFRMVGMLRVDGAEPVARAPCRAGARTASRASWSSAPRRPARAPGLLTPTRRRRTSRALAARAGAGARARGVRIFEGTEVLGAAGRRPCPDPHAGRVGLGGGGRRRRRPRGRSCPAPRASLRRLQMLATTPAPAVLDCPVYVRDGHEYAQQLPDGRVALGGFSDLDGAASWTDREESSALVQARLDDYLRDDLRSSKPR